MDVLEFNPIEADRRPKTLFVLMLLSMAALVFSYLYAYCLTDALVAAEVLTPFPGDLDPRPRKLMVGWFVLMTVFLVAGWMMNRASSKHLRSIEEMEQAEV